MAASPEPTANEYIVHHLTHNFTEKPKFIVDFSVLHLDTIFFSVLCLALTLLFLRAAARRASPGVPGKFQAFVEMLVELVEEQSKSIVHGNRAFIAPLALTVFIWIVVMNAIDLLPVELIPWIANNIFHIHYVRPLPTADVSGTIGLSLGVLLLMLFYGVKIKGFGGFAHELFTAPFGSNPILWPFNLLLNIIEYLSKFLSLGLRLFGNMYAGELLFFLIALLGGAWGSGKAGAPLWIWGAVLVAYCIGVMWLLITGRATVGLLVALIGIVFFTFAQPSMFLAVGHVIAGTAWLLFHILIVLLQAFIFMMLTLAYIGQAHEGH